MITKDKTNDIIIDQEFKDNSPIKTVERIKGILRENSIDVSERWNESNVPFCYSMRITVNGTNFGVNGKGLNKEFAMASAYGELMERLQLGYIGNLGVQKNASFSNREQNHTKINADRHLAENINWYNWLAERYEKYTGNYIDPISILDRYKDEQGMIRVMDHYNITKKERTYFPVNLHGLYTTNGAAAGNSPEEALVQAISETVERYNHLRVLHESITLPDIPEDILAQNKAAYRIITYVREQGYKVTIKDASLGQKFPVVCAIFIQESTGKYHTHFGAFPIFEIALERALTETFQGRNIDNIAGFDEFHYNAKVAYSAQAITAELITGTAEKFVDFFAGTPKFSYNATMGFNGQNNKELLKECIEYFKEMGYDILVRDRSCLGFPALQIIIPGYSEWAIHRLAGSGDDSAYMPYAVSVMRNPVKASSEDIAKYLEYRKLNEEYSSFKKRNNETFQAASLLSVKMPSFLDDQLLNGTKAYISYQLGHFEEAANHLSKIITYKTGRSVERLICLKRYLMMKANNYSSEQIQQMIHYFHRPETALWLDNSIENGKNPFEPFVLHCDEKCDTSCLLSGFCNQNKTMQLIDLIMEKISNLSFDDAVESFEKIVL